MAGLEGCQCMQRGLACRPAGATVGGAMRASPAWLVAIAAQQLAMVLPVLVKLPGCWLLAGLLLACQLRHRNEAAALRASRAGTACAHRCGWP